MTVAEGILNNHEKKYPWKPQRAPGIFLFCYVSLVPTPRSLEQSSKSQRMLSLPHKLQQSLNNILRFWRTARNLYIYG